METSPLHAMDQENIAHARVGWRLHRIATGIMLVVVAAALVGVFSDGPVSAATVVGPEGDFAASYDRFARRGGSSELKVRLAADEVVDGRARLFVGDDLHGAVTIQSIVPTPTSVVAAEDGTVYEFSVANPGVAPELSFSLTPGAVGWRAGTIGLPEGERVTFHQLFYP